MKFKIGDKTWETGKKIYLMGILNVTPDSFSDGGNYNDEKDGRLSVKKAVERAKQMVSEGADIIDVGGESTRPGHTKISEEEEIARVVPVIRAIKESMDVPVSIDTYKYEVAKAAIDAGADMLNSIWGFIKDGRLAELTAATGVSVCLMHNRDVPVGSDAPIAAASGNSAAELPENKASIDSTRYMDIVCEEINRSLNIAARHGIDREKIIIDPGVGFGKPTNTISL